MELDRGRGYGEIGYWVAAARAAAAIATRAVRLLATGRARSFGLRTIEILVASATTRPPARVAERAGFADTGELRAAPREPDAGRAALRRLFVGGVTGRTTGS